MAWGFAARVRELCRKTGWHYSMEYMHADDMWRVRFYDAHGNVLVSVVHPKWWRASALGFEGAKIRQTIEMRQFEQLPPE